MFVAAAAAAACTGAVLVRERDRAAELELSRLQTLRTRDEFRYDERIAELECDLEEFREIRARYARKLNGKRSELAKLRGEHAGLLRRYATAEADRATALESVRLALGPGPSASPLSPSAFLKANAALNALEHNAAVQSAVAEQHSRAESEADSADIEAMSEASGASASSGAPVGGQPQAGSPSEAEPPSGSEDTRESAGEQGIGADALRPTRPQAPVNTAVAIVPPSAQRGRRTRSPEPGFDYFGTQRALPAAARPAGELTSGKSPRIEEEDLADVVGEEISRAEASLIDLTEHDETETIDVRELRALS
ncbi:hypothetical protein GCM10012280_32820 [Wenjunlia tyrosinilytica]|uniref:Secreted protein n=1 Tax=Wenjunlia tyrosinilytica TaxID=1544741 RepID=A0A917ZQE0_9ACTN|nr:hypothetical protein GCM10012280_32820 [Wenjunlia tyrosinilytica]